VADFTVSQNKILQQPKNPICYIIFHVDIIALNTSTRVAMESNLVGDSDGDSSPAAVSRLVISIFMV